MSLLYIFIVGKNHNGSGVRSVQELFDNSVKVNRPVFALLGDSHRLSNADPAWLRKEKQNVSKVSAKIPKEPGKVTGEEGILNSEYAALPW